MLRQMVLLWWVLGRVSCYSEITALLFFRILLLGTRTETCFDGLGQLCGDGWRRQAVWLARHNGCFIFLTVMSCLHSNACHKIPGLREAMGGHSVHWPALSRIILKIPCAKSLQDNLCPSVEVNVETLS